MFNLKRFLLLGSLGAVVMASFLALPMVTGQSVAHAQARIALATPNCTTTTNDQDGNFVAEIPSTSSGNVDCIVGLNDDSSAVKALQTSMNHCYAHVIEQQLHVDGIYGQLTMEAMKDVQAALGIPPSGQDGIYGPVTRGAGFQFWGAIIQPPHAACAPDLN